MSALEDLTAPELVAFRGQAFVTRFGARAPVGLKGSARALLGSIDRLRQPYVGPEGAALRSTLIPMLMHLESDSHAQLGEPASRHDVIASVPIAETRVLAEVLLARCLLENGDSRGAIDAAEHSLKWMDECLKYCGPIGTAPALHGLRQKVLTACRSLAHSDKLLVEDLERLIEAVKQTRKPTELIAYHVAFDYRKTVLTAIYAVSALKKEQSALIEVLAGSGDRSPVESFVQEVLAEKGNIWDAEATAQMASDYTTSILSAVRTSWPVAKIAAERARETATVIWGADILDANPSQLGDAGYVSRVRNKVRAVSNPVGYYVAYSLTSGLERAMHLFMVQEGVDTVLVSSIEAALFQRKNGRAPSMPEDIGSPRDPVSGRGFRMEAGKLRSTYRPSPDDPEEIKDFCGRAFSLAPDADLPSFGAAAPPEQGQGSG